LGDRSVGTGNTLWSDGDIDIALDVAYGSIWTDLIDKKSTICRTVSYVATTTDAVTVALPASYAGEILWVNVANDGSDLSADADGAPRIELVLTDATEGWQQYKRGAMSTTPWYFMVSEGSNGKIFPPPGTGGTTACEICHTYWPTWAAATTATPDLPVQWRPLISYKAAKELRDGYDMPSRELAQQIDGLQSRMYGMQKDIARAPNQAMTVHGRTDVRQFQIRTGIRRRLYSWRSRLR
jgi:hypothetical protein